MLATAAHPGVTHAQRTGADSVSVQAGAQYAAGGFHRWLFGADWRDLWTVEVTAPVLDLGAFAGGLTPTTAGGGRQTKSLRFRGADGYQYGFRSVDKDPAVIGPEFANTFVEDLVHDQTSSQFPYAPSVVAPLLEAAGVLHTTPALVVLPDDARLGEFRERFAGTLGYIERRATIEPGVPAFAGAREIIESPELLDRLRAGPADLVDAEAFLTARLMDLWVGDWDRHRGQWTWARRTDGPVRTWIPIPEDRDQAFARFDGVALGLGRLGVPVLLSFEPSFGSVVGATWNGRDLDREILSALDRAAWERIAAALVERLTDSVIDVALATLPAPVRDAAADRLATALRSRRDALPDFAARFYDLLAREAAVHATDRDDHVALTTHAEGSVTLTLRARPDSTPWFTRTFDPAHTRELRVFLHGGRDRVVASGPARSLITLRVIGGGGAAEVVDSLGGVRLYATAGDRAVGPEDTHVDHRPDPGGPPPPPPTLPYRDWGRTWFPMLWTGYAPDVGLFLGGGAIHQTFGFRRYPYKGMYRMRGGWAFGANTGRADIDITVNQENSRLRALLYTRVSGIEVVRYNGLGNATTVDQPNDYYRVRQAQVLVVPALLYAPTPATEIGIGPMLEYVNTHQDSGRVIADLQPRGVGKYGQLGVRARASLDTRDGTVYPTRGVWIRLDGAVIPPLWHVDSTYGWVEAAASTYLTAGSVPLRPTLALRAGGRLVAGPYPFFAAAFIGDAGSARLGYQHRYGGDASLYGNAELRLRLTRFFVILPGEIGAFGLADVGRVFLDGETSSTWHSAFGGGIWLALLEHRTLLSAALAATRERTGLYLSLGMAY